MRTRLVLLLVVAFSALGVWRAIHLVEDRDGRVRVAEENLLVKARMVGARQDALAERADAILNGLITNPMLDPTADAASCRGLLGQLLSSEPDIEQFGVARPDGSLACSALTRPRSEAINFADRAWFQSALRASGLVIGDVVTSRTTGNPTIPMSKSRRDPAGEVVAVYYGGVDLDWMGRSLAAAGQHPGERVAVVDGRGVLVARYPDPENWVGTRVEIAGLVGRIRDEMPGTLETVNRLGERRLVAHVPLLRSSTGGRYQLLVSIPRDVVEGPARSEAARAAGGLLLALLLTAAFLMLALGRWVVTPVVSLSKMADRLRAGEFAVRNGPPYSGDEVGSLAHALDDCAESIQERERRLAHSNRALRVLSAGNQTLLRCHVEPELLQRMGQAMTEAGGYRLAWIAYLEADGVLRTMEACTPRPTGTSTVPASWRLATDADSPLARTVATGSAQVWVAHQDDMDGAEWTRLLADLGCRASITLPIQLDGAVTGVLTLGSEDATAFDTATLDILVEASQDLSLGIRLARDEIARQRMVEELRQSRDNLEQLVDGRTAELVQARDQAQVATRSKSAFLANMSHESRTPLNAIIGLNHLVLMDAAEPRQRDRFQKIDNAAQHLLQVISDILDLSKIEAGGTTLQPAPFARDELIARCLSMVSETAKAKGLRLISEVDALPTWLCGDRQLLAQALINLLANAVKFTDRGQVSLRASVQVRDAGRLLVSFAVTDTGIGIPLDRQGALFNAFEQADVSTTRIYGGTGLGLALTRQIAALMGGEVGLDSRPGSGSTFWFSAWLDEAKAPASPERDDATPAPATVVDQNAGVRLASRMNAIDTAMERLRREHAGRRVLMAEDNAVNREVASELLQRAGLLVEVATTGAEAIERANAVGVDLVLMDVQMPVMNGIEAARALRATFGPALPIIALTAGALVEEQDAAAAAGMNDFIAKPIDPQRLYDVLREWLTRRSGPG